MSFVANLLFFMALLMQTQELSLQRQELKANREEMAQARLVAEQQEVHLRRQVEVAEKTAAISRVLQLTETRHSLLEMKLRYEGEKEDFELRGDRSLKYEDRCRRLRDASQRLQAVTQLLDSLIEKDYLDPMMQYDLKVLAGMTSLDSE